MKPSAKPFVWWALLGALLVSTAVAVTAVAGKRNALADASARLAEAQQERDRLTQELTGIHHSMEEQAGRLAQLQANLAHAEQDATRLRQEYAKLQQSNAALSTQLSDAAHTNAALEARLSSVRGLTQAIREIRAQQWRAFWAGNWPHWTARVRAQREADQQRLAQGNRGLLVRNGLPTTGRRATLQVRVLDPQTEGP